MDNDRITQSSVTTSGNNSLFTSIPQTTCNSDMKDSNQQARNIKTSNSFSNGNGNSEYLTNMNGPTRDFLYNNNNNISNHHQSVRNKKYLKPTTGFQNPQINLNDWLENCVPDQGIKFNTNEMYDNESNFENNQINGIPFTNGSKMNYKYPFTNKSYMSLGDVENYLNPTQLQKSLQLLQLSNGNNQNNNNNNEFTSLPPDILNSRQPIMETNETNGFQDLLNIECAQNRRFSDPGFGVNSDENDSINENLMKKNENENSKIENSKLLTTLLEQINLLHETNTKICRNLHETKVEIEALKQAPNWGLRHRRDSISGLSTHSQPLGYNFGTQSPAPTYHSGMYTPGMLTDVVREVREAARIREEAVLNRVKSLVDERSWSLNEKNFRLMRDIEELKAQIHQMRTERKETNQKLHQLETEIKSLKSLFTHTFNRSTNYYPHLNNNGTDREYLLQARSQPNRTNPLKKNHHHININYGIVNHDDGIPLQTVKENEITKRVNGSEELLISPNLYPLSPNRYNSMNNSNDDELGINSPINSPEQTNLNKSFNNEGQISQLEKDNIILRRELQNAKAASNNSEYRIKALEQVVTSLQNSIQMKPTEDVKVNGNPSNNNYPSNFYKGQDATSILKIIENSQRISNLNPNNNSNHSHNTSNSNNNAEPQVATQVQEVIPTSGNRKSGISLTGPVTDL